MSDIEYQERLVAFIDVLGFANLTEASGTEREAFERVSKLVATSRLFERYFRDGFDLGSATFFSDSFVLSMGTDQIIYLVREMGYLCRYLLLQGLPCRGGIALGKLYHEDNVVVGPALVAAYRLESKACFPRVVLDEGAMACWEEEFSTDPAHANLETLVMRDRDEKRCLDLFHPGWHDFYAWTEFVPSEDEIPRDQRDFLRRAETVIRRGLGESGERNQVRQKYEWLNDHLQARVKENLA